MDRQRPYGNRGNHPGGKKVRKMVALYDYDPQELSPNVDAEVSNCQVELSFWTADIVHLINVTVMFNCHSEKVTLFIT